MAVHHSLKGGTIRNVTFELIASSKRHLSDKQPLHQVRTESGERIWLLPAEHSSNVEEREIGTTYEADSILVYDPTGESVPLSVQHIRGARPLCEDCGELVEFHPELPRPSDEVTTEISQAGISALVLVEIEETTVVARSDSDDWRFPMGIGSPQGERRHFDSPTLEEMAGKFRCPHCGHVSSSTEIPEYPVERVYSAAPASGSVDQSIGMATGGAKDVANFRDNIDEGILPQPRSLTDEGLFYDYYFDTEEAATGNSLFYPTYSAAASSHPLTGESERYLAVGLGSSLSEDEFERNPLDLVAVLDVSGSMSSQFKEYYYDQHDRRHEAASTSSDTKVEAATSSLAALTKHLTDGDRFGVVLFNSNAGIAKPLRDVPSTDMDAIRRHIQEIQAGGGTDMAAGYETARGLLGEYTETDLGERESRIIFMTDAMPNTGQTSRNGLTKMIEDASVSGIHTTFIGMGLDANAELISALSKVRGANHYFIHSVEEFERRLDEEFEYMVTPLVFDLSVDLVADGYEIDTVYGSPSADTATGEVMHVTTLFPSASEDGASRGGIILLKLRQLAGDHDITLEASWTHRDGSRETDTVSVETFGHGGEYFESGGVRKAVVLARYADLLRDWMHVAKAEVEHTSGSGLDDWHHHPRSEWERASLPLVVPDPFCGRFEQLHDHIIGEMAAIEDETLGTEADVLQQIIDLDCDH